MKIRCLTPNSKAAIRYKLREMIDNFSDFIWFLLIASIVIVLFLSILVSVTVLFILLLQALSIEFYGSIQSWIPITFRSMFNWTIGVSILGVLVLLIYEKARDTIRFFKIIEFEECNNDSK